MVQALLSTSLVMGRLHDLTVMKVQSLTSDLRKFYESEIQITIEQSIAIASVPQGTKECNSQRKKILTASSARSQHTFLANPKADWDKRYKELYHSSFSGNEDTMRGLRCEPLARDSYEENTTGTRVFECGLFVRPELPWLGASLDGVVVGDEGNIVRSLEIKTLKEGTRLNAAEFLKMNVVNTVDARGQLKKTGTDHYAQVQVGMLLSGIQECDYIVHSEKGNDFRRVNVPFDAPYVLDLVSRLSTKYFDIFLPRIKLDFSS